MKSIAEFVSDGINSVTELQDALQTAMRLEFSTIPPYLCAEWSIKSDSDQDNVARKIHHIVLQEMFHFALAGNMLKAIGRTPEIANPQFLVSYPTNELPGGITQTLAVDLKPLSPDQLQVFLQIEMPEFPVALAALADRPGTIGAFYTMIASAFTELTPRPVIDLTAPQVTHGVEVTPIRSIDNAVMAIGRIKQEGEGVQGSPQEPAGGNEPFAHYFTFNEIFTGKTYQKINGHWSLGNPQIHFPGVNTFQPSIATSNPSIAFNKVLSQLLVSLQTCWTSGGDPDTDTMDALQAEGVRLIGLGIRPEFAWEDPS